MSPEKITRTPNESDLHYLERRLDALGDRFDSLSETLGKLASAKLLQQAFTGLILGAFFTVLVHVIGG